MIEKLTSSVLPKNISYSIYGTLLIVIKLFLGIYLLYFFEEGRLSLVLNIGYTLIDVVLYLLLYKLVKLDLRLKINSLPIIGMLILSLFGLVTLFLGQLFYTETVFFYVLAFFRLITLIVLIVQMIKLNKPFKFLGILTLCSMLGGGLVPVFHMLTFNSEMDFINILYDVLSYSISSLTYIGFLYLFLKVDKLVEQKRVEDDLELMTFGEEEIL